MHGCDSEHIVELNVVVPVLQIRKEIGEVTKLIPKERISECFVGEITGVFLIHLQDKTRSDDPAYPA